MGSKTKYDDTKKAAIAGGWEQSGLSQEDWAKRWGISSRTLRHYLRRYHPARHWDDELQTVVTRAAEALAAIVKTMNRNPAETKAAAAPEAPGEAAAATGGQKFRWDD